MNAFEEKENELIARRDELLQQLKAFTELRHQLEIVESNLKLIAEIRQKASVGPTALPLNNTTKTLLDTPSISIGQTFIDGMKALQQFTKNDVVAWVRANYPNLVFSEKSMQRPLQGLIETGEVILLKKNQGSKTQAVYGYKRQ
jgi:hypothetical protein